MMEWDDERISEKGLGKEFIEDYFRKRQKNNLDENTVFQCYEETASKYGEEDYDIDFLLQYDGGTFIYNCYKVILGRVPDEEGYLNFCKSLDNGMPKEAVVYLFINSEENKNGNRFKRKEEYRNSFETYQKAVQGRKSKLVRAIRKIWGRIFRHNFYIKNAILDSERKRDLRDEYYKEKIAGLEHENRVIMEYIHAIEKQIAVNNGLIKELVEQND